MNARAKSDVVLRSLAGFAVVFASAAFVYIVANSHPTYFDDAYMFVRYANNILGGHGHAWNPGGEQTYGSTSLLHVVVVTVLKACLPGMEDGRLLVLASAIPGGFLLLALVFGSAKLARHEFLRNNYLVWGGILLPALVLQETFKHNLRNGMDTMLSALCLAGLVVATLRTASRPTARRMAWIIALAYLSCLARPDNGIYATLFPVLCILLLGVDGRWKWAGIFCLGMATLLALDLAVKQLVFGTALPLSFYAKQHGMYEGYSGGAYWNPIVFLREFAWTVMPFLCLIVLFVGRRTAPILTALFVPVVLTFGYYFTVNQIMGYHARFYFPALAFVVVGAAAVVDDRFRHSPVEAILGQREFLFRLILTLLIILGARQVSYTLAGTSTVPDPPVRDASLPVPLLGTVMLDRMGALAGELPPGTVMALSEYGKVGAAAPRVVLIDVLGLHEKEVALNGFSAEWLFSKKPDLIWFPHSHYTRMVQEILDNRDFQENYIYYPGGFELGFAIRRDSLRFEEISGVIRKHWKLTYGEDSDPESFILQSLPRDGPQ